MKTLPHGVPTRSVGGQMQFENPAPQLTKV